MPALSIGAPNRIPMTSGSAVRLDPEHQCGNADRVRGLGTVTRSGRFKWEIACQDPHAWRPDGAHASRHVSARDDSQASSRAKAITDSGAEPSALLLMVMVTRYPASSVARATRARAWRVGRSSACRRSNGAQLSRASA